jgi:hypothetical protein
MIPQIWRMRLHNSNYFVFYGKIDDPQIWTDRQTDRQTDRDREQASKQASKQAVEIQCSA